MRMCLSVGVNVDVSEGVYGREFERVSKKLLIGDTLLLLSSYLEKKGFLHQRFCRFGPGVNSIKRFLTVGQKALALGQWWWLSW